MTTPAAASRSSLHVIADRMEAAGLPFSWCADHAKRVDQAVAEGDFGRAHGGLLNACSSLKILAEVEQLRNPGSSAAILRAELAAIARCEAVAMKPLVVPSPAITPRSARYDESSRPVGGQWSSRNRAYY